MAYKYPSAICIKDWSMDCGENNKAEYKKGRKYRVLEVKPNFYNGNSYIKIRTNTTVNGTCDGCFWSGSEYFNVDEYIKALKL